MDKSNPFDLKIIQIKRCWEPRYVLIQYESGRKKFWRTRRASSLTEEQREMIQ